METCFCHTHAVDLMRHPHMCAPTNGVQQPVCSAPSVFHANKAQVISLQLRSQMDHPQRISWLLVAFLIATHIAHVMALGWLKKGDNEF